MCFVEIYDSIKWNNWVAQLINNKRIKRHSFDSVFHATVEHNVFHASNPFSCHFTIDFLFSTLRFSSLWILFSLFFFLLFCNFQDRRTYEQLVHWKRSLVIHTLCIVRSLVIRLKSFDGKDPDRNLFQVMLLSVVSRHIFWIFANECMWICLFSISFTFFTHLRRFQVRISISSKWWIRENPSGRFESGCRHIHVHCKQPGWRRVTTWDRINCEQYVNIFRVSKINFLSWFQSPAFFRSRFLCFSVRCKQVRRLSSHFHFRKICKKEDEHRWHVLCRLVICRSCSVGKKTTNRFH